MIRPRAITYLALLLTLCLTAGAMGAVGISQARLADAATVRNTVLLPRSGAIESDCLISEGEQVVLLGELGSGQSMDVAVTLKAVRDFSGPLTCTLAEDALIGLDLDFTPIEGESSLDAERLLEMKAGAEAILTLVITAPDAIALTAPADVRVACGDLQGIFRVTLAADPPEETEPEETQPEDSDSNVDVILPGEGDVSVVLPGEPGNPVQTSPSAGKAVLSTLSEFEMNTLLPVKATLSGNADLLRIGLQDEALLPMTRYSTDGGQSWYLLYEGGYVELTRDPELEEESQWLLLVDLAMTEPVAEEAISLEGQVFLEEQAISVCYAETVPREGPERPDARILKNPSAEDQAQIALMLGLTEVSSETETEEPTSETETDETTEPTEFVQSGESGSGVSEGAYFEFPLSPGWSECSQIRFWAQILTKNEDGTIDYVTVPWDPQSLNAVTDPEAGSLIVYVGEQSPAAGTYRLTLECMYEGICFQRMQTTFFINYSTPSVARSEEVPENE